MLPLTSVQTYVLYIYTGMSHWRSHRGHWGTCPLPLIAYSVTQNSAKMHQNTPFLLKRIEKVSGDWAQPLSADSFPGGGG